MSQPGFPDSDVLRDHWWPRPGWRPGRITYTWHLTFDGAEDLHRLVSNLQQRLSGLPGLDHIPARWLHLTVQSVGYTDEISDHTLHEVVDSVRSRVARIPAFDVEFGRATILREGVVLLPSPDDALQRLWREVRAGIADAVGADRLDTRLDDARGFLPHVSLVYSRINTGAKPYRAAVDAAPIDPATVHIGEIALIRQDRVLEPEWVYRWEVDSVAHLG